MFAFVVENKKEVVALGRERGGMQCLHRYTSKRCGNEALVLIGVVSASIVSNAIRSNDRP